MLATEVTENTEANACFVVLIRTAVNVGAALAANNPSDRDELAAEAAPKLKTSVFSVTSMANNYRINPLSLVKTQCIQRKCDIYQCQLSAKADGQ